MVRRRYRRKSYRNWSEHHTAKRDMVATLYGGVDADVREVFFNLPPATLIRVLADYKEKNGQPAYAYAKKAYGQWKSGKVQMSGQVSERLLAIVPCHLDFGVKYDLLEKLCRRREVTRVRVEIAADMTASEALQSAIRAIENARSTRLPDYIVQRLHWLADNDGKVAQSLLSQVFDQEYVAIVRAVQQELVRLLALSSELAGKPVDLQAQREITLPGAIVQIVLNSSSRVGNTRSFNMPDKPQNHGSPKSSDGAIVPTPNAAQGGQLAPIQNPQNLLEEALKRMSPEKQAEILSKAADEALRLQVKRKESELDLDIISDKIDQAGKFARNAAQNPNVKVNYNTEHRSKQGDTRIQVTSKSGCLSVVVLFVGGTVLGLVAWLA